MIFYQKCLYSSNLYGLMCRNVLPILYPVWLLLRRAILPQKRWQILLYRYGLIGTPLISQLNRSVMYRSPE